jgi:hypothetical protein
LMLPCTSGCVLIISRACMGTPALRMYHDNSLRPRQFRAFRAGMSCP